MFHKGFAVVASAVAAIALSTIPAVTATADPVQNPYVLPANTSVYVIDYLGRGIFESDASGTAHRLDLQVGTSDPSDFADIESGAFNYVTNKIYVVDNVSRHLGVIDALGGPFVDLGPVSYGTDTLSAIYGLVIMPDGAAKLLARDTSHPDLQWGVFDLDLTTGVMTNPVWVTPNAIVPYGFGIDPTTGRGYFDTSQKRIIEVDLTSGLLINTLTTVPASQMLWDGKFDSNGVFWMMDADYSAANSDRLFAYKPGDSGAMLQGTVVAGDVYPGGPVVIGNSTTRIAQIVAQGGESGGESGGAGESFATTASGTATTLAATGASGWQAALLAGVAFLVAGWVLRRGRRSAAHARS